MSKTLALFISGLGRLDAHAPLLGKLTERLTTARGPEAWGYEFDVQTRWGYYAAGSPNIIATSFAITALSTAAPHLLQREALLGWLERQLLTSEGWFRYIPGNDRLIHNANLLAARSHAQFGGDPAITKRAVEVTLNHQRRDGAWLYGRGDGLGWIDNFHTVYVLQALHELQDLVPQTRQPLNFGIEYWRENLFDPRGLPRYFANGAVRNDIHNIATALSGLVQLTGDLNTAEPTLKFLIHFQGRDGGFRSKSLMPSYMRWNNAHAFEALTRVVWANSSSVKYRGRI